MKGGEPGRTECPVWSACHHGQSRGSGLFRSRTVAQQLQDEREETFHLAKLDVVV